MVLSFFAFSFSTNASSSAIGLNLSAISHAHHNNSECPGDIVVVTGWESVNFKARDASSKNGSLLKHKFNKNGSLLIRK